MLADSFNAQTTQAPRTVDSLKLQWENLKKHARKESSSLRIHSIRTGGGPPKIPKKDDPICQRVLSLIKTSAVGLYNPYDNDSAIPIDIEYKENISDSSHQDDLFYVLPRSSTPLISEEQKLDMHTVSNNELTKDWGDYTPKLLKTPVSMALKVHSNQNAKSPILQTRRRPSFTATSTSKDCGDIPKLVNRISTEDNPKKKELVESPMSRRRPSFKTTSTLSDKVNEKKIEVIERQVALAFEENERAKELYELELQIRKEKLAQEKINTSILKAKYMNIMKSMSRNSGCDSP